MLYEVKIYDANNKLKKVISEKQVQINADKKFKEGHTPQARSARFKNKNFKNSKNN